MQRTPGAVSTSISLGICASWKARMLAAAAAMASLTAAGTSSEASRISSADTSKRSGTKPSISAASAFRASSPSLRTRATIASTRSRTTGLTSAGRRHSSGHSSLAGLILISIIYGIILSTFSTRIPSAPIAFSCLILSQRSASSTTECMEHQPSAASGITVGLLMAGSILTASSTEA